MTQTREIKRIPRREAERRKKPVHPLYFAFCNAKSAAIEIARTIASEKDSPVTPDVQKFLDEFGRKAA